MSPMVFSWAAAVPVLLPAGYSFLAALAESGLRSTDRWIRRLAWTGLGALSLCLVFFVFRIGSIGDMTNSLFLGPISLLRVDRLEIWTAIIAALSVGLNFGFGPPGRPKAARGFLLIALAGWAGGAVLLPVFLACTLGLWLLGGRASASVRPVFSRYILEVTPPLCFLTGALWLGMGIGSFDLEILFIAAATGQANSYVIPLGLLFLATLFGFVMAVVGLAGRGAVPPDEPFWSSKRTATLALAAAQLAFLIRFIALFPALPIAGRIFAEEVPLVSGAVIALGSAALSWRARNRTAAIPLFSGSALGLTLAGLALGFKAGASTALFLLFSTSLALAPACHFARWKPQSWIERCAQHLSFFISAGCFPGAPLAARLLMSRQAWDFHAFSLLGLIAAVTLITSATAFRLTSPGNETSPPNAEFPQRRAPAYTALLAAILLGVVPGLVFEPLWRVDAGLLPAVLIPLVSGQ